MDGSNRMSVAGLDLDRLTEMMIEWGLVEVLMLTAAAVTAFALSVVLQRPFRRAGLVDHPDHRKQHGRPVPLSGGVAVALAIVTLVWIFLPEGPNRRVLEAATALLVVGILDDRYDLGVSARLFWQILAGVWIVEAAGLAVFSLGALGELDLMAGPFTVLCVVTFVNACNMVDGADGLLAGALVPTCIGIALVSDGTLQSAALLTGGALLGFLGTNWPAEPGSLRARWRSFLGNGGVKFVAVVIAATLIVATEFRNTIAPHAVPFLVLIPLAELANSIARRIVSGMDATAADNRHFHHRLLAAGCSRKALAYIYAAVSTVSVAIGLAFTLLPVESWVGWTAAAIVLTAATLSGVRRAQRPVLPDAKSALLATTLIDPALSPRLVESEQDDR